MTHSYDLLTGYDSHHRPKKAVRKTAKQQRFDISTWLYNILYYIDDTFM